MGLGNPGLEYRFTRHNVGFHSLDVFLSRRRAEAKRRVEGALAAQVEVGGEKVWFIKPQTYMNRSGDCVVRFVEALDLSPREVLVMHDEADLSPGRVRIKLAGGSGGHRGLESIFCRWGTRDFYRLRVGIGKDSGGELTDYVLEGIPRVVLDELAGHAADALEEIFTRGVAAAMSVVNAPSFRSAYFSDDSRPAPEGEG